jgi:energy-coupling factor transporter transmembrane protein EcfT
MKLLNELLGFAVLTSPLWLILILLVIAVWIAAKASKRLERRSAKFVVGLLVFLLVFFVALADEITGKIYFNYLCATEAGVKVYKTIRLPAHYWDKYGKPRFYDEKNGNFYLEGYRVEYQTGVYSSFFHIDNAGYKRMNGRSGEVLGEVNNFRYWGGWMRRNLSPHNTANACEGLLERSNSLIMQIFKRENS